MLPVSLAVRAGPLRPRRMRLGHYGATGLAMILRSDSFGCVLLILHDRVSDRGSRPRVRTATGQGCVRRSVSRTRAASARLRPAAPSEGIRTLVLSSVIARSSFGWLRDSMGMRILGNDVSDETMRLRCRSRGSGEGFGAEDREGPAVRLISRVEASLGVDCF